MTMGSAFASGGNMRGREAVIRILCLMLDLNLESAVVVRLLVFLREHWLGYEQGKSRRRMERYTYIARPHRQLWIGPVVWSLVDQTPWLAGPVPL